MLILFTIILTFNWTSWAYDNIFPINLCLWNSDKHYHAMQIVATEPNR